MSDTCLLLCSWGTLLLILLLDGPATSLRVIVCDCTVLHNCCTYCERSLDPVVGRGAGVCTVDCLVCSSDVLLLLDF